MLACRRSGASAAVPVGEPPHRPDGGRPLRREDESLTYYNGGWYARRDVETVLVMGVDKYAAQTSGDNYNQQQHAGLPAAAGGMTAPPGVCRQLLPLEP